MNNEIAKLIIENREKKNISQRELARRIEIDNAYLSRIEKGEIKKPSVSILMKLSKEFELNFLNLLFMTYSTDEIDAIGVMNNINEVFNFIDENKIDEFTIIDENNNKRISIKKILDDYKNEKININETIGLLSCLTNKNCYNYLTKEEIKRIRKDM